MRKWSEMTTLEKTARIISETAFCVWIFFEIFIETEGAYADIVSQISILVICVSETVASWNNKRYISYIALGGLACLIAVFILQLL